MWYICRDHIEYDKHYEYILVNICKKHKLIKEIQVVNTKKNRQLQQEKQYQIVCLDHPSDDDLSKFYYIESQTVKGNWYKLVATAFGAVSCSCINQTRNPYKSCKHMKILDEIIEKSSKKIEKISKIPLSISDIY